MNKEGKKVAFTILFEKNKTSDFAFELREYSNKVDACGKGYITFACNITEFKDFLKELPKVCENVGENIKLYGRVVTDSNNCTFFNYEIDAYGIEAGDAQVISKTPGCDIPLKENASIGANKKKEETLCY